MSHSLNPGIFFILGFNGIVPQDDFLKLIDEFPPAGFLLLERNFEDPDQLTSLTSRLKSLVDGRCIIAVDQEPGRVQRFKAGFPISSMPDDYLRDGSMGRFRDWCTETAGILKQTGITMNLAPVVDMISAGRDCPVLHDRTFGDQPGIVSEFAGVLIEQHKQMSVLTCVKHFPGLGAADNDPHEALAVSDDTIERFQDYHWYPFAEAVKRGVDWVMTTHLLATAIDDKHCATYSKKAILYLRRATGHSGAVISDDLAMRGAGAEKETGRAVINAVESGHNFVIVSGDTAVQHKALKAVAGQLSQNEILRSKATENAKIIERICGEIT
jgi:beta-N-acetylhexosaminidase